MWKYKDANNNDVIWYSEKEYLQVCLLAQRALMANMYLQNIIEEKGVKNEADTRTKIDKFIKMAMDE